MLTNCPHCGNKISDTAEKCVHCGKELNVEQASVREERMEEYAALPKERQNALISEFHKLFPEQAVIERNGKLRRVATVISSAALTAFFIFECIYFWGDESTYLMVIGIVLGAIGTVIGLYLRLTVKAFDRKMMYYNKVSKVWLKECKNANLNLAIDEKYRGMYDGLIIEESVMRKIAELKSVDKDTQ